MRKAELHMIGHTLLRVFIGLMFVIAGFSKITGIDGIIGLLGSVGFPAASFFAWVLAIAELGFGFLIFIGFRTKYTTWPLAFVLLVAWLTVVIPSNGITSSNSFFHLTAIAGLITIALTGPGKYAITKE